MLKMKYERYQRYHRDHTTFFLPLASVVFYSYGIFINTHLSIDFDTGK